ncbi:MAG: hypothetical protein SAL07_04670 [Oscillatoria sp. PMC 1051.18]|uniref:hypothetical protein n=1 Tax=Oscillatoria salina TaxID=331517 RepID=UPI0013BE42F6|nr:hypothetical protein [Oscillatoria salina]MBZ8179681.1 hypothetical protein [Oscillatoria salina IIICB1]MEC4893876.1 hypothetical protein [Oscillatoria sp. PMC 1050.18]MEC5029185.1 hypothetical protein [Oscillatoria sp. PMC 1051.18]NET87217.1 hypothetical protein [Kamptonema sp. SIO1D9]
MSYTEQTREDVRDPVVVNSVVDYHDRVRWGPIFAGIVIAISTQLVLSALGAAIGFSVADTNEASAVGLGVGIWSIISLFISLFIGAWVMARTCGPMNNKTALLNGAILWATTLAISSWLLASGVSGTFGVVVSNAGEIIDRVQEPGGVEIPNNVPNLNTAQATVNAAKVAWSFIFGSLLGLVASMIGAIAGARKPNVRV